MAPNPLSSVTGRSLNILITIASTCGFLLFGYDNGVFSGIIVNPWFLKTFHHPTGGLLGTVSAMYNIGGLIGSVIAFFIGNPLGRRRTILTGIAVTTIGAIPFCTATNIGTLLAGRIICGIGVGVMTSTVGLWQAETTPSRSRGRYLVFQLLGGAGFGLFMAQWINYGFHSSTGRVAFVFPVAFQLVFLAISGVLVTLLPESPRWLVKKDRTDEALVILIRLEGLDGAQERLARIMEADALEKSVEGSQLSQLFKNGPTQNFRRLCLACGVMIMHQLGGINSVTCESSAAQVHTQPADRSQRLLADPFGQVHRRKSQGITVDRWFEFRGFHALRSRTSPLDRPTRAPRLPVLWVHLPSRNVCDHRRASRYSARAQYNIRRCSRCNAVHLLRRQCCMLARLQLVLSG